MEKGREILNYLFSGKNYQSLVILFLIIISIWYVFTNYINPRVEDLSRINSDIETNKERYEGLVSRKQAKDKEEKRSKVKIEKVNVKLFQPQKAGLPLESASIDFVTTVISMLEKTENSIMDISYKTNPLSETEKTEIPSTISVVQLVMKLNGSYTSLQDFVFELYDYDYLATIKSLKVKPLKENKNKVEISMVLWLYIKR